MAVVDHRCAGAPGRRRRRSRRGARSPRSGPTNAAGALLEPPPGHSSGDAGGPASPAGAHQRALIRRPPTRSISLISRSIYMNQALEAGQIALLATRPWCEHCDPATSAADPVTFRSRRQISAHRPEAAGSKAPTNRPGQPPTPRARPVLDRVVRPSWSQGGDAAARIARHQAWGWTAASCDAVLPTRATHAASSQAPRPSRKYRRSRRWPLSEEFPERYAAPHPWGPRRPSTSIAC